MNIFKFLSQVRIEASKISWLSLNEVFLGTIVVVFMVSIATLVFFLVDYLIQILFNFILTL